MSIPELEQVQPLIEAELDDLLPSCNVQPERLHKAMRYSVFAGGKRLRPALVILASRACGGEDKDALPAACAVELIHTYSLIHDDLPAMDDDDMRRGKPSCHTAFGEATAILAGDALLTLAFETTAQSPKIVTELAQGSGSLGMVGGQAADLEAEGTAEEMSSEQLGDTVELIHERKTAALIRAAVRVGGISARCSESQFDALSIYGRCIGLAFQITDDILDITGTSDEMGKAVGKDQERGKLVHPAAFGMENSKDRAKILIQTGIGAIEPLGVKAEPMTRLAQFVLDRTK